MPAGTRGPLSNGDVIVKVDGMPGMMLGRYMSDAEFYAHMMEFGAWIEPANPCPPPVQPLRLVP